MSDLQLGVMSRNGTTTLGRDNLSIDIPACPPLPTSYPRCQTEHVRLWGTSPDLAGPISGIVEFTEVLGRETFVGIRIADELLLTACVDGRSELRLGDRTEVGLVRDWLYAFDTAGRRLCRF